MKGSDAYNADKNAANFATANATNATKCRKKLPLQDVTVLICSKLYKTLFIWNRFFVKFREK